jgi:hypothetical protein
MQPGQFCIPVHGHTGPHISTYAYPRGLNWCSIWSLTLDRTSNMGSSHGSREVEHLLSDRPDKSTASTRDDLGSNQHRPSKPFEYAPQSSSSSAVPNIEYAIVPAEESLEESYTLTPSALESTVGKDDTPISIRQRTINAPWTLQRLPLLSLIAWLVILVVVLEILYFWSNKHQGITTSTKNTYYLWKYCPTASKSEPYDRRHVI